MLDYALAAFAIAALGGLILASSVLRGRLAPWPLSLLHAGLGALGLVLLLIAVLDGAAGLITLAFILLVVAALGGFYLASMHLRKEIAPSGVVVIHAGVAVVGFLLLAGAAFNLL